MSTAVAEKPAPEATPAPVAPFEMPHVRQGMEIVWWPKGIRIPKHDPSVAIVLKVWGNRNIDLRTTNGHPASGVMHIDDPRLQNPDVRESGGWDYTDEYKQRVKDMADLKAGMVELKSLVTELRARVGALELTKKA